MFTSGNLSRGSAFGNKRCATDFDFFRCGFDVDGELFARTVPDTAATGDGEKLATLLVPASFPRIFKVTF